jgi:hypothetical protein
MRRGSPSGRRRRSEAAREGDILRQGFVARMARSYIRVPAGHAIPPCPRRRPASGLCRAHGALLHPSRRGPCHSAMPATPACIRALSRAWRAPAPESPRAMPFRHARDAGLHQDFVARMARSCTRVAAGHAIPPCPRRRPASGLCRAHGALLHPSPPGPCHSAMPATPACIRALSRAWRAPTKHSRTLDCGRSGPCPRRQPFGQAVSGAWPPPTGLNYAGTPGNPPPPPQYTAAQSAGNHPHRS